MIQHERIRWALLALLILSGLSVMHAETTHLRVLAADLNSATGQVKVELFNESSKTVVAYSMEARVFDAASKLVSQSGVGYDYANLDDPHQIGPGSTKTAVMTAAGGPGMTSVRVTVLAVVYSDRTAEGQPAYVGIVFDARARQARAVRQALSILEQGYPETADQTRNTISRLLDIRCPAVNATLSNQLQLPYTDKEHPAANPGVFSRDKWDGVTHELSRQAESMELLAQEVRS